jgi:hypothetical protein
LGDQILWVAWSFRARLVVKRCGNGLGKGVSGVGLEWKLTGRKC